MRAKEVWIHGVDLRAGLTFADLPPELCVLLVDEVLALFGSRDEMPDVTVLAPDVGRIWGSGSVRIEGTVTAIAAWLTRDDATGLYGEVPAAPAWLV